MNIRISLAAWLLLLAIAWHPAHASQVSTEHATVSLLSEQPQASTGQTLWLGLHFELIPHWHVYWRNPGASGSAPVINWTLPAGWEAGDIRWPVPERIRVGPLTNYGYEKRVTFLVPVRVPDGPLSTGPLRIAADARWLVCREECVPEDGRFTLTLNDPAATPNTETRVLFDTARSQWPEEQGASGSYSLDGESLALAIDLPDLSARSPSDVWFAANAWGPVDPSGVQSWTRNDGQVTLRVPVGDVPPAGDEPLEGLLVVEAGGGASVRQQGYMLQLPARPPMVQTGGTVGLVTALAFALLGGLILNVMPCVLPVLGIKVLGFVREAQSNRRRLALHGLNYAAGVVVSFALLASVLLTLRAGGASLGWGFQLQSPALVALLAYLMLLVGLNLAGVFSVGGALMGAGQSLTAGSGLANTFATGVLAAVVASPCTAPFMGAALGFAITRPAGEALVVFLALGAGLALPVVLLSLLPAWVRFIPKPGPWMKRFQQLLAFPMFATAAWLVWVLSQQTDPRAYAAALAGFVLLAMAAWLYGQWQPRGWRLALLGAGTAAILALAIGAMSESESPADPGIVADKRVWSEEQVRTLTAAGRPVFVNFTAAWCITCKVNEQVALATDDTRRLFRDRSVAYLVADWTRRDPGITRQLERYGRSGVPLYLLFSPAGKQPIVLPQLLTEAIVADAVDQL